MSERIERMKIEFEYKGKEYCLEFTPASLKKMERGGFKFGKIDEMLLSAPEQLFNGAFLEHHAETPNRIKHEIYTMLARQCEGDENADSDDYDALAETLAAMLNEGIEELNGRGKQGNVKWRVSRA